MQEAFLIRYPAFGQLFSCFCVTETWLNDSICNNKLLSANFAIYCKDRGSRGGGVLIAVSNLIPSHQILISSSSEIIMVEIALSPKIVLCCVYVPPASSDVYLKRFSTS